MANVHLTNAALKKLKRFIIEESSKCVHETSRVLVSCTSQGTEQDSLEPMASFMQAPKEMNDWVALYFAQASLNFGQHFLGRAVVSTLLSFQSEEGYVPALILDGKPVYNKCHCKPLLAQTLERELSHSNKESGLSWVEFVEPIGKYLNYYRNNNGGDLGLFHWHSAVESGVPNNLALLAPLSERSLSDSESLDGRLLAVDLCAYLIGEFRAYGVLAAHCGKMELSANANQLAESLNACMEQHLWNDQLGLYCNFDPVSNTPVMIRSWTGLLPALLGVASPEHTKQVIERNVISSEQFLRPFGLASLAKSDDFYSQARQGLYYRSVVPNWQGPVWILPNILAVRCLVSNGYLAESYDLSQRVLAAMSMDLENTGTLHESYCAETGKPLWQPHFIGWNAMSVELMNIVEQVA